MKLACVFLSVALLAGALAAPIPPSDFSDLSASQQAMYDAVFKGAEPTKETLLAEANAMAKDASRTIEGLNNLPKLNNLRLTIEEIEANGFSQANEARDLLQRMAIVNEETGFIDGSGKKTRSVRRFEIIPEAQVMYDTLWMGNESSYSVEKLDELAEELLADSKDKQMSDPEARETLAFQIQSRKENGDLFIDEESLLFGMYKVNQQTEFFDGRKETTKEENQKTQEENQKEPGTAPEDEEESWASKIRDFFRG